MKKFLLFCLAITLLFTLPASVFAQEQKYSGLLLRIPPEYNGFTFEFFMDPGETRCDTFTAQHDFEDPSPRTFFTMTSDLDIDPVSGNPIYPNKKLILDQEYSLAAWVKVGVSQVDLPRWGVEKNIPFCVTVPLGATSGTHYGVILLSNITIDEYLGLDSYAGQDEFIGSALGSRVGVNLLVTVAGEVEQSATVQGMSIVDINRNSALFNIFEYLPLYIETNLKNEGNQFLRPYGNITIHQGDITKPSIKPFTYNPGAERVLPARNYRSEVEWIEPTLFSIYNQVDNGTNSETGQPTQTVTNKLAVDFSQITDLKIGRYFATAQVAYKDVNGQHSLANEYTIVFWIIPWKLIILLIIIITLIIVVTRYRRMNSKSYKTAKGVKKIR